MTDLVQLSHFARCVLPPIAWPKCNLSSNKGFRGSSVVAVSGAVKGKYGHDAPITPT